MVILAHSCFFVAADCSRLSSYTVKKENVESIKHFKATKFSKVSEVIELYYSCLGNEVIFTSINLLKVKLSKCRRNYK